MKIMGKIIGKIIGGLALATTLTFNGFAQDDKAQANSANNRNVGTFSKVDISGGMDVYLTEGNSENIKIEAKGIDLDKIITEVNGDELKISMKNGGNWSWGKDVEIKVYVTYRTLKSISSSGSSDVFCKSKLKNESMNISVSGSGNLTAEMEVKDLEVRVSGSSDIRLAGKADTQDITISGSGDFKGGDLEGKNVKVKVSGSGDASVWANESIEARVSGSGDISYKGNPSKEISKVSGSGSVRKS
jgi:hypothetical protein